MDDGGYSQVAPKAAPRASAPAAPQRPASSGFDDMEDDIPF
jgi:single-strand DNA-binding protein